MELEVKNKEGAVVGSVDASDFVWAQEMNGALLHQVIVAQQANRRQGTHSTLGRSEVRGSGRKLRIQKHTGRARIGDAKAPHLRGGGVAHGARPRSYRQKLPVRMRRQALRVALSDRARNGTLTVVDDLSMERPRTKDMAGVIHALGLSGSTLLVTREQDRGLRLSARNLESVDTMEARLLSALEAQRPKNLVLSRSAVEAIDEIWGHRKTKAPRKVEAA